jgi:hypothetical protein
VLDEYEDYGYRHWDFSISVAHPVASFDLWNFHLDFISNVSSIFLSITWSSLICLTRWTILLHSINLLYILLPVSATIIIRLLFFKISFLKKKDIFLYRGRDIRLHSMLSAHSSSLFFRGGA